MLLIMATLHSPCNILLYFDLDFITRLYRVEGQVFLIVVQFYFLTNHLLKKRKVKIKIIRQETRHHSSVGSVHDLRTGGRWFDSPVSANIFPWIDGSHCDRIHFSLTAVICLAMWKTLRGFERIECGVLVN